MVVLWSLVLGFRFVVICLFDLGDFGMDFFVVILLGWQVDFWCLFDLGDFLL